MAFYCFDGQNTTIKWLFDTDQEKAIIREINALPLKEADADRLAEMTIPTYGLEISDKDGFAVWLTYSRGLWLLKDGTVYEGTFDFPALYNSISDTDMEVRQGGASMLNASYLAVYDNRYLEAAEEPMPSSENGVTLSIKAVADNIVTIAFENESDEDFWFGHYFSLQKEMDGRWYTLPVRASNYGFTEEALLVAPHETVEDACPLEMYGALDPGNYRIVKEGLAAPFVIEEQ
ncbi:MAG: hypothetical protein Q4B73_05170 [Lachnospiraceae bacterium]|nr:hypothetical protein [Lachnospiraceae bacterium]